MKSHCRHNEDADTFRLSCCFRAEHTRRLLEAAQLYAADADAQEEEPADVQLALMAAEMR